jgi:hypothetical protein
VPARSSTARLGCHVRGDLERPAARNRKRQPQLSSTSRPRSQQRSPRRTSSHGAPVDWRSSATGARLLQRPSPSRRRAQHAPGRRSSPPARARVSPRHHQWTFVRSVFRAVKALRRTSDKTNIRVCPKDLWSASVAQRHALRPHPNRVALARNCRSDRLPLRGTRRSGGAGAPCPISGPSRRGTN